MAIDLDGLDLGGQLRLKGLYEVLRSFMLDLGDDVQERVLKYYIAFKRLKNFACVTLQTQKNSLILWLGLDPDNVQLEEGFSRDVRDVGHYGTGDLEITIRNKEDLEKAKPLIQQRYEESQRVRLEAEGIKTGSPILIDGKRFFLEKARTTDRIRLTKVKVGLWPVKPHMTHLIFPLFFKVSLALPVCGA